MDVTSQPLVYQVSFKVLFPKLFPLVLIFLFILIFYFLLVHLIYLVLLNYQLYLRRLEWPVFPPLLWKQRTFLLPVLSGESYWKLLVGQAGTWHTDLRFHLRVKREGDSCGASAPPNSFLWDQHSSFQAKFLGSHNLVCSVFLGKEISLWVEMLAAPVLCAWQWTQGMTAFSMRSGITLT